MMTVPDRRRAGRPIVLPRRTVAAYAAGSLATGTFGTVPGLVLLYFLTDTLAVPAALAGAAVFVPKFLDVLWNPVVGGWSDRTTSRLGPRRPWMLAGSLTLPPLFLLMFAVPDLGPTAAALWVATAFLLAGAAYGLFQVPYISLPAELTTDPGQRSRLQSSRVVVVAVGILVGGAAAPALVDAGGGGRGGYLLMGAVVAVVLAIGTLGCTATVPTTTAVVGDAPTGASLPRAVREARGSERFWALFTGFLLQSLALAVALAAIPYYARYVLDREGFASVLFAGFVGPALLVTPLWRRAEARRGKRWCLVAASWLFAAAAVVAAPGWLAPVLPTVAFFVCGIAYAGLQVFAYSMLTDTLAERSALDPHSDSTRAGLLAGLWTASETAMFAVGPGVVAALLAVAGFVSSSADETVAQPGRAIVAIAVAAGVIPALLVAASTRRFARYTEPDAPAPAPAPPSQEIA
jgi:GPH family glycoside/pentoside/hexuronide:cation symporter